MDAEYPNTWIFSADHELDVAQILFEQGGYSDVVAYHIHQGLERYLKGFLASREMAIPAVRDLGELIRRAAKGEPELLRFVEDIQPFTEYFVETLEDEILLPQPSREDIRHAMEIAWRLRRQLTAFLLPTPDE